jgi:glutamyl-tRNA reductase
MTIVNVGISHRSAPAGALERLAGFCGEPHAVLRSLRALSGVDEIVVLSTCNRVEVYAAVSGSADQSARCIAGLLADRAKLLPVDMNRLARLRVDGAAAEHLFTVTSGLDSMAIGEQQIVGQVKAAARHAATAGTSGPTLTGLFDAALRTSKRVRTETTIDNAGVSLTRAGIDMARDHVGELADTRSWSAPAASAGSRLICCIGPGPGSRSSAAARPARCRWPRQWQAAWCRSVRCLA